LPNFPWNSPGIIKLFPARVSLARDIPAGDGKIINLFYSVQRIHCPVQELLGKDLAHINQNGSWFFVEMEVGIGNMRRFSMFRKNADQALLMEK
jgi:hypothetical protein